MFRLSHRLHNFAFREACGGTMFNLDTASWMGLKMNGAGQLYLVLLKISITHISPERMRWKCLSAILLLY